MPFCYLQSILRLAGSEVWRKSFLESSWIVAIADDAAHCTVAASAPDKFRILQNFCKFFLEHSVSKKESLFCAIRAGRNATAQKEERKNPNKAFHLTPGSLDVFVMKVDSKHLTVWLLSTSASSESRESRLKPIRCLLQNSSYLTTSF